MGRSKESMPLEQRYQKKTQLEHILLRPDTYVGSTEREVQTLWVYDANVGKMAKQEVSIVPALYKIFDEILVNASDHHVRDKSMNQLRVDVDESHMQVRVWNNGSGIPVAVHAEHGVYIPELVFGHLLTSSNYDDEEKKVTGGRNGYGAKLTNVFSKRFTIETFDSDRGLLYEQTFEENMTRILPPRIRKKANKQGWTCVSFQPDFTRFGMNRLDNDALLVFRQRAFDVAGILGKTCKVLWNGTPLGIRSFSDYVRTFVPDDQSIVFEQPHPRWSVAVTLSDSQQFEHVSFVNGIRTTRGGTHVQYVSDKLVGSLVKVLNKKMKTNVRSTHIKPHLWIFLQCQIENPAFDSQTKETLTTRPNAFGSSFEFGESFYKKVMQIGLVDRVNEWLSSKSKQELKKSDGSKRTRLTGIAKLDDANWAGTKRSKDCMLILTEGLSAKALAVAGLSVVGRDKFGVYPLRGKLLNVRDAPTNQVTQNTEISELKQILGLKHGTAYEDVSTLRYGHLVIMTDQDNDGSHIKGLIMNFLHVHFPSLLRVPGFLLEFVTPIVRAKRGNIVQSFYTLQEYVAWTKTVSLTSWNIKYYKGLGTSTAQEAKEYFSRLDHHLKPFVWDGPRANDRLSLAFSKSRADDRKEWIATHTSDTFLDHTSKEVTVTDFVDRELVAFSVADLRRSIPSVCDGLKPGQRKVLHACFLRNIREDIKLAQLAGYVSEKTAYHHGEASLHGTMIGMAQTFVGSNNVNLLVPSGQFGSRAHGGSDAASPRYIFTRLEPIARLLFPPEDDACLTYLEDDGQIVEPQHFVPILPMVLINGAEGIGTGWRTFIPNHNPKDVIENVKRKLQGKQLLDMHPWYKGFQGSIARVSDTKYSVSGKVRAMDATTVEIKELPVRMWTQGYKEWLEACIRQEKGKPRIEDYKEHHSETHVHFTVKLTQDQMVKAREMGLYTFFHLESQLSMTQLVLFDSDGKIKRYASTEAIFEEWFECRYRMYESRRAHLIEVWNTKCTMWETKARFIRWVLDGTIDFRKQPKTQIDQWLSEKRVPKHQGSYDFLWSIPVVGMTLDRVRDLEKQIQKGRQTLDELKRSSVQDLWLEDLAQIEALVDV